MGLHAENACCTDLVVDANVLVDALTDDGDHGAAARAALRDNLTGYDAGYVADAEHLGVDLVTRDAALHATPGIRCTVRVP